MHYGPTTLPQLNVVAYPYPQDPFIPPPSFVDNEPVNAMPLPPVNARPLPPVVLTAITPCCGRQCEPNSLLTYVNRERRCPFEGSPLNSDRVIIVSNPQGPVHVIHHHVAPRQLSLLDRLWNGVKTVVRFAVRLIVAAFKILWEVVKIALRIVAYTLLGVAAAAVILNPTPASIIALGILALVIAATDRPRCCRF